MKTRNGFVSNSSSTSFILYGDYFEPWNDETYQDLLDKLEIDEELGEAQGYEGMEEAAGVLEDAGYDALQSEEGLYYGVIIYEDDFGSNTEALCKKLRKARDRALKLGLKDCPVLYEAST